MTIKFQVKAIPADRFEHFKKLNMFELGMQNSKWVEVDSNFGYPCRVSLTDAKIGEKVLLLPFVHHDVDSPYQASGPIFVRENAKTAELGSNEIPEFLNNRLLSIRVYSSQKMLIAGEVVKGTELTAAIERQLNNSEAEYIQIHNASYGCYLCLVNRI